MIRFVRFLSFFFLLPCFASCELSRNNYFMNGAEIKISTHPENTVFLSEADTIISNAINGAYLIRWTREDEVVLTLFQQDFNLKLIDTNNGKIIRSFVPYGEGPQHAISVGPSIVRKINDSIYYDLLTTKSYQVLNYTSIVEGDSTYLMSYFDFNGKKGHFHQSMMTKSGLLCKVIKDNDLISYKLFDTDNNKPLKMYDIFSAKQRMRKRYYDYSIFEHIPYMKPDGTKVALLMSYIDKINILDLDGDNHFSIAADQTLKSDTKVVYHTKSLERQECYKGGCTTDSHIYAIHSNLDGSSEIYVFDWQGKWLMKYHINNNLIDISVDECESRMFALSNKDDNIYIYHLPALK